MSNVQLMDNGLREEEKKKLLSYCSCDGNERKEMAQIQTSGSPSLDGRTREHTFPWRRQALPPSSSQSSE